MGAKHLLVMFAVTLVSVAIINRVDALKKIAYGT
jgi:hypothetical protein